MQSEPVKLVECPRDAWQGLKQFIPTDRKVDYLRTLIDVGFRHIDAVSFVSPKAVPQMADSEQVLEQLMPPPDVEIIGIVVNERGADRAIATGAVRTLGYPCSVSPTFLRRNQNQSPEENAAIFQTICGKARDSGLDVVAYISMAFGNPYGDHWSEADVAETAAKIVSAGVGSISLADTIGIADAPLIATVLSAVLSQCSECEIGVHLHSTRATAEQKVLAGYDAGCRRFDAALGGLGGCPFAQDELIGNIPTEQVLHALTERGVKFHEQGADVLALNSEIEARFSR